MLFRRRWKHAFWLGVTWAALISFSQIYVGVHYPADILAGAILGTAIGLTTGYLFNRFFPKFLEQTKTTETTTA